MARRVNAQWFDPTNGTYKPVKESPFINQGVQAFSSAGFNAGGRSDWVLILEVK